MLLCRRFCEDSRDGKSALTSSCVTSVARFQPIRSLDGDHRRNRVSCIIITKSSRPRGAHLQSLQPTPPALRSPAQSPAPTEDVPAAKISRVLGTELMTNLLADTRLSLLVVRSTQSAPRFAQVYSLNLQDNIRGARHSINPALAAEPRLLLQDVTPYISRFATAYETLQTRRTGEAVALILNPQMRLIVEYGAERRCESVPGRRPAT